MHFNPLVPAIIFFEMRHTYCQWQYSN